MTNSLDLGSLDPRLRGLERPANPGASTGLCRAIAARYGIDPLLVRLGFVVLVCFDGMGWMLYLWGTLLTPRAGAEPPIRRILPIFENWTRGIQLAVIIGSTVAVPMIYNRSWFPIGPLLIIGLIIFLLRRQRGRSAQHPSAPSSATSAAVSPLATATPALNVEETIAAWREKMAAHGTPETRLPEIDLYAPEPEPAPPPRTRPAAKGSWLGAGLALGAGALPMAIAGSQTSNLLWVAAVGSIAMGLVMICWAVLLRRRLPGIVLAIGLAAALSTAAMVYWAQEPAPTNQTAIADGSAVAANYAVVGQRYEEIDLRNIPLDQAQVVNLRARLANVKVILKGAPLKMTSTTKFSEFTPGELTGAPASKLQLNLDLLFSKVTLEVRP